ncbi:MAG: hypothetical protein FH761_16690 [Firmicutes bacterium]|nr:hypothetical protein [Bacillota bacterium]
MHIGFLGGECKDLQEGVQAVISQKRARNMAKRVIRGKVIQRTEHFVALELKNGYRECFRIMDLANPKNDDVEYKVIKH